MRFLTCEAPHPVWLNRLRLVAYPSQCYSLDEAARALLASRVDGVPLSTDHGFPARMVEPHKRGYDWVKWVDSITVNDTGKFWQPSLPLT